MKKFLNDLSLKDSEFRLGACPRLRASPGRVERWNAGKYGLWAQEPSVAFAAEVKTHCVLGPSGKLLIESQAYPDLLQVIFKCPIFLSPHHVC